MRLTSISALLFDETIRTWRRRIIAGVLIVAFGIAAIVEGISAIRMALYLQVGPVWAPAILAGIFLVVVVVTLLVLYWRERRAAAMRATKPFGSDERVSALAEAISLGYTLAQDFRRSREKSNGAASDAPPQGEAAAAAADHSSVRREP